MNAVEIEQAVSELAEQPFDAAEFPYAFLMAFGNKETTIKRLRTGASNKSDFDGPWGGVLQTNNIHLATCAPGDIAATLTALRDSPATTRAKAKFILATDGIDLEAEDITTGELRIELTGDLNTDGFVGIEDLDIILANWNAVTHAYDYASGDVSGDGVIDATDLQQVIDNWGNGTTPGGNVPEPGSLAVIGLGGLAWLRRRRA